MSQVGKPAESRNLKNVTLEQLMFMMKGDTML